MRPVFWILLILALVAAWAVLHDMHQSSIRSDCVITQGHSEDYCRQVGR